MNLGPGQTLRGSLEAKILGLLWRIGCHATGMEIREASLYAQRAQGQEPASFATIATTLRRLSEKGVLRSEKPGRGERGASRTPVYTPLVGREEMAARTLDNVSRTLLGRPLHGLLPKLLGGLRPVREGEAAPEDAGYEEVRCLLRALEQAAEEGGKAAGTGRVAASSSGRSWRGRREYLLFVHRSCYSYSVMQFGRFSKNRPLLILLAVLVVLFVCANLTFLPVASTICSTSYGPSIPLQQAHEKTDQDIAQLLVKQWLDRHRNVLACPFSRVTEYRIRSIQANNTPTEVGGFAAAVSYDVHVPELPWYSLWETMGSGAPDHQDGWIRNHTIYVHIKHDGSRFYIESTDFHAG